MGFGKIQIFVLELARRLKENEEIVVICGNNKKLEETLKENLEGIEGYASLVSQSRWQSTWKRVTSFYETGGIKQYGSSGEQNSDHPHKSNSGM